MFGLRPYFPQYEQRSTNTHFVVFVRQGGTRMLQVRHYPVLLNDDQRLESLTQRVHADMVGVDTRINKAAITLADGINERAITSNAALDRLLTSGIRPTLIYTIDAKRAPNMTRLPDPPRPTPVRTEATVPTLDSRLADLSRAVVDHMSAALGATATLPTLAIAHEAAAAALSANAAHLAALGIRNPVHQTNLIAADLAASACTANAAAITPANAPRVFRVALEASPAWNAIRCRLAPACKNKKKTRRADADEKAEEAALKAQIGSDASRIGPVRMPIVFISSAVPSASGGTVDVSTLLSRIGFQPHTAADYTLQPATPTIAPIGADAGKCQEIGHKYCGRRCRRFLRQLEFKHDAERAAAAAAVAAVKTDVNVAGIGGDIEFLPLGAAPDTFKFSASASKATLQPVADDITFEPIKSALSAASAADDITFEPISSALASAAADDITFEPIRSPLASTAIADDITFEPLRSPLASTAPLDLSTVQPAHIAAKAPAGYRVLLRNPADNTEMAVGATPSPMLAGVRHVTIENADGRRCDAGPVRFRPGQTSTISVELKNGRPSWQSTITADVGSAIAAAFPQKLTANANELVLLHTDGRATTAPIGAWAAISDAEHEATAASGHAYIFDASRSFVADANNCMHPVLAVAKHPTVPGATVVLLPAMTMPASD